MIVRPNFVYEQRPRPIRHRVVLHGIVTDASTKKAIGGARVLITGVPPDLKRKLDAPTLREGSGWRSSLDWPFATETLADGHFHFMDLPEGEYTLTASCPGQGSRLGTVEKTIEIVRDNESRIGTVAINLELRATTVKGKITGPEGVPVFMAEIQLLGGTERDFSKANGEYTLARVEKGTRSLVVVARGFSSVPQKVTLAEAGAWETLDFALERDQKARNGAPTPPPVRPRQAANRGTRASARTEPQTGEP